ncbi:MAG TPA: sensor histidine kinase [Candidatus Elarobacter sp.]|nr:sensor histidine kinase [Candidatus Elarobacter sp.]
MANAWRRLPIRQYGVMPYLWLIYVAAVPATLWVSGASARVVALQLVLLVIFLALYIGGYGRRGPINFVIAGAMAILGTLASPSDAVATTYFVYAATFLPWGASAATAYRVLAGYVPLVALYMWLMHVNVYGAIPGVVFSLVVGVACINGAEEKRAHAQLQQAHDQIERLAKIAERERIARDLHDVLGHTLSLIALKSQLASKLAERDPQRAVQEIRAVEEIARTSLDELREAVAGYRGAGIPEELAHARDVLTSAGVRVECDADDVRLTPVNESVLTLAIREAVTNVVRHAHASVVRLRLAVAAGMCRFEIQDDGVGGSSAEGFGLTGMRERVESHGGSLERTSEHGTRLIVTLPLAPGAAH